MRGGGMEQGAQGLGVGQRRKREEGSEAKNVMELKDLGQLSQMLLMPFVQSPHNRTRPEEEKRRRKGDELQPHFPVKQQPASEHKANPSTENNVSASKFPAGRGMGLGILESELIFLKDLAASASNISSLSDPLRGRQGGGSESNKGLDPNEPSSFDGSLAQCVSTLDKLDSIRRRRLGQQPALRQSNPVAQSNLRAVAASGQALAPGPDDELSLGHGIPGKLANSCLAKGLAVGMASRGSIWPTRPAFAADPLMVASGRAKDRGISAETLQYLEQLAAVRPALI